MAGGGGVPEWAATRDGGGSAVDWDGRMGAQRREAATHDRRMGETSFCGDLVFFRRAARVERGVRPSGHLINGSIIIYDN